LRRRERKAGDEDDYESQTDEGDPCAPVHAPIIGPADAASDTLSGRSTRP
jgi:hypothetical protein